MVKNIQTNTVLGSVFDEEHAGSHNFTHNLLHHCHFDVQKNIVLRLYYVVQRSTCGGAYFLLQQHAYAEMSPRQFAHALITAGVMGGTMTTTVLSAASWPTTPPAPQP